MIVQFSISLGITRVQSILEKHDTWTWHAILYSEGPHGAKAFAQYFGARIWTVQVACSAEQGM